MIFVTQCKWFKPSFLQVCHLEQTCLLPLQAVNELFLLSVRWEILLLWPLIKIWHHMNMPGLAPSTDCVKIWGDQLMLGRGMAWTPGKGKMWHSYAPEDLWIQLCTLVTALSLGNMDLPSPKCCSSTTLLSVSGGVSRRFWHGTKVAPLQ